MNKRKKGLVASVIIIISVLLAAVAFAAEPGSGDDPLVTKSYIDSLISEVKSYVDEKVNSGGAKENEVISTGEGFKIVRLAQGQRITFGESTELIVRMGKGAVIASEKGGIADVTAGVDLAQSETTSANHLLIVPVGDGRGFEALEDVIVMVKGSYQIN